MNLKKVITIICIIFLLVISFSIIKSPSTEGNSLIQINYDDLMKKLTNKESFVLCISRTDCGHCATYKPLLNSIASKNKIIIYYIEADLLTPKEKETFLSYINFDATPTTVFIKDGEEKSMANRIIGSRSEQYVIDKLKNNGFIA